ncbi:hypothetical protein NIES4075_20900 [Tolypothrix sp. NIES-4075]|uniref:DUF1822 family protein n=1 Tax=Tolypothrix sp. NIES-4075 TaxID=2005459 RepID=UPI000B5C63BD|nr:DUF1822 family protein [Tolypothrix sp. NIES-4075]GAX41121.1 hypothetical protein NIES4075_20900 [Tolypothrix sp. NIES-4075]
MTSDLNELMVIYPEKLWLEISDQAQEHAWRLSKQKSYSHTTASWNAYLNNLSLHIFLAWLREDPDLRETVNVWLDDEQLASVWEVVNGTMLTIGDTKLVLIPSDKSNFQELRIPQEWVDIPNWAGNYYLAVQLNLEERWFGVWGYATHQQIRKDAKYDSLDQTYSLDVEDLITDLNVMWVAREVCPVEKLEVEPLSISSTQVDKLLAQLSKFTFYSPRLDVPFEMWGALLAVDEYRQRLYQRRLENQKNNQVECSQMKANNLSQWFENIFEVGWQSFDALISSQQKTLAVQFRSDATLNDLRVKKAKLIDLGMQLGGTAVVLLLGLTSELDEKISIRVQLHPANEEIYLPPHLRLILLSESGKILQEVQSRSHDHLIQLKKFKSYPGKNFSIKIAFDDISIKEDFVL